MNNIPVYDNQKPLRLSKKNKERAAEIIAQTIQSLNFLKQRIYDGVTRTDSHTHMLLLSNALRDLSPLLQYDDIQTEELENQFREVQALNHQIHILEEERGKCATPDALTTALQRYANQLYTWCHTLGLHYAEIKFTLCGLQCSFAPWLSNTSDSKSSNIEKPLFKALVSSLELISANSRWDTATGLYSSDLLDTDRNKTQITQLFTTWFPHSRILSFQSKPNDSQCLSLQMEVFIPYEDINHMVQTALNASHTNSNE